jgi:hypothetical protein
MRQWIDDEGWQIVEMSDPELRERLGAEGHQSDTEDHPT